MFGAMEGLNFWTGIGGQESAALAKAVVLQMFGGFQTLKRFQYR